MYTARDVMSTDVFTIRDTAMVSDAMRRLVEEGISGAPVVDGAGRLVGIISEFQLLEAIYSPQVKEQRVGDLMTRDVLIAAEDTLLSDVANLMIIHRIRRLPVLREGELVGIVARRDLLRYILQAGESLEEYLEQVQTFAAC